MKRWLLLLWLLVPLPVVVWHYGPGQKWLARDRAQRLDPAAPNRPRPQKDWAEAESLYPRGRRPWSATAIRPSQDAAGRGPGPRRAIGRAARWRPSTASTAFWPTPTFHDQPADLQREARELAGRIHYYAAWVMRLEGAQRDLWMEEAELARQNFRLLTETSLAAGRHALLAASANQS